MPAEFAVDDYIFVLQGRTVDIFHRKYQESQRHHVAFMGIEVEPKGDRHLVKIGRRTGTGLAVSTRVKLSADDFARFQEWAALCIAARDGGAAQA